MIPNFKNEIIAILIATKYEKFLINVFTQIKNGLRKGVFQMIFILINIICVD